MPSNLNRREALGLGARALLAGAFVEALRTNALATEEGRETLETWLRELRNNGGELGSGAISPLKWQERMDEILKDAPLESLLRFVDFERMSRDLAQRDLGARGEVFVPVDVGVPGRDSTAGQPEESRLLITKLAHVKRGESIPPHGHENMVSAFLCLSGRFHVRLFDRLEDREQEMIVRQSTDDAKAGPGTWSSISDYRDNVHWLTALTDDCFLFTSKLIRLEDDREFRGRINVDVRHGRRLGTNTIRAPKITSAQAAERY